MKPKLLSWNVRGYGGRTKRMLIKNSLRKWRPNIVCLQETKVGGIDSNFIRTVWGGTWYKWKASDANGSSGGILVMWDCRNLRVIESEIGMYTVSCLFQHVDEDLVWSFIGVYGPIDRHLKMEFLEEIGAAVHRWQSPWCVGGDFNMTRCMEEKWNCNRSTKQMHMFSEFINDLECHDLPLNGGKFTWSNRLSKSRLGRFLVSSDWEDLFPEVIKKAKPQLLSDHFPLMLDGGGLRSGPRPFRFENMWLHSDGFTDLIATWWQTYSFYGSASYVLSQKLKSLKMDLKRWNLGVFGRIENQKIQLEREIQTWDHVDKGRFLSEQEKSSREEKIKELNHLTKLEEISWRQKSRVK